MRVATLKSATALEKDVGRQSHPNGVAVYRRQRLVEWDSRLFVAVIEVKV